MKRSIKMMASSWGDATNADLNGFVLTVSPDTILLNNLLSYTMQAMNHSVNVKHVKSSL
jgi:hypothetical protein